jgi:molybdopterin-guanine dinucleotide biosynthesis protein A
LVAGIFVGGAGRRMQGQAKGLLRTPDGVTLVDRLRGLLAATGAEIVLVGAAEAYASLGLEALADEPPGVGPMGGLAALLRRAGRVDKAQALAVACDLPYVSSALLARLVAAPPAPVVAPVRDGRWEPLCARYDAARVRPVLDGLLAQRRHALQAVLDAAGAVPLPLLPGEADQLRDWDSPQDIARDGAAVARGRSVDRGDAPAD